MERCGGWMYLSLAPAIFLLQKTEARRGGRAVSGRSLEEVGSGCCAPLHRLVDAIIIEKLALANTTPGAAAIPAFHPAEIKGDRILARHRSLFRLGQIEEDGLVEKVAMKAPRWFVTG